MAALPPANFLTLPTELRNTIYNYIFIRTSPEEFATDAVTNSMNSIARALHLLSHDSTKPAPLFDSHYHSNAYLRVLQTCKQIHGEANLLALAQTPFHLTSQHVTPECFARAVAPLSFEQQGALRHVTLTARISHLRALNETWGGLPFGHAALDLDTLTVVPRKVDAMGSAYAEVADLSQSHTLAYILAETLKRLRHVRVVQVCNRGCFNEVVWRLVYRSLVYRMWRWGGEQCGVRFESAGDNGEQWFRIWLCGDDEDQGREVGEEVVRLVGGRENVPDPNMVGF